VGQGVAGYVAKFGKTVRVTDAYRDKRFLKDQDEITGYRTRSILAAPMKNHVGRTIGVIQVLNKQRGRAEFSQHDEELLSALATQAAVSIDNSRLFLSVIQKNMQLVETKEQLEHRVSDLKLLFELESAMGRAASMSDLARAVVGEAARACGAGAGALMVDEQDTGVWLYFVDLEGHRDASSVDVKRVGVKRTEGITGWSMTHNEALSLPQDHHRGDEGPVSARLGRILHLDVSSAIAVPLEGEDEEAVGSMALYNSRRPHGFSQDDRALLRLISANASTAVQLFRSRLEHEKSERLTTIGRLLSGVMHDMRTPLTVISGYVQLMANAGDAQQRQEHARLILKQFDHISAMQRDVLEFARGERIVLVRKVYLAQFFADVKAQLEPTLAKRGIDLVLELKDKGTARFDEGKIQRVINNLARNAEEAMAGRGGKFTIRVMREGDDVVLQFADTGPGIPKEIEHRVFQSFVTSGKKGGTGLGLAIVKKIAEEHNGTVDVHSTSRGATFTLRLPQGRT
ncbi:MAG TPA: GAF domain-containing sensor histidine kinase, partial [Polyangiales bacterium]|nr:GAF domain-containing sensor histidine kinase [Polyangiales bacterium]